MKRLAPLGFLAVGALLAFAANKAVAAGPPPIQTCAAFSLPLNYPTGDEQGWIKPGDRKSGFASVDLPAGFGPIGADGAPSGRHAMLVACKNKG